MACQLVGSRFHEVVSAVVAQPQGRDGRIDGDACCRFALLHEPGGAVHVVVQLLHVRVCHVPGGSALAHPEHEFEEVDASGYLVVDHELRLGSIELVREGSKALAEGTRFAVDVCHRRCQSGEFCLCSHPYLAPDDVDAGHLYAAEAAERVAFHLHTPGQHVVFVHVRDMLQSEYLAPFGLLLEVVVGEESAPHVPVVGLGAALLLCCCGVVERCPLVAHERIEIGSEVISLLFLKDFLHVRGPWHALEGRFVAAEAQHGGLHEDAQVLLVLVVCPVDVLFDGFRVKVVAE